MTGSMDERGDVAAVLGEDPLKLPEVVVGDDVDGAGLDVEGHLRGRVVGRADLVEPGLHRHLEGVVAAVVAALDLHDRLAVGVRPGGPDRVHQGLGAGVGEAHHVEPGTARHGPASGLPICERSSVVWASPTRVASYPRVKAPWMVDRTQASVWAPVTTRWPTRSRARWSSRSVASKESPHRFWTTGSPSAGASWARSASPRCRSRPRRSCAAPRRRPPLAAGAVDEPADPANHVVAVVRAGDDLVLDVDDDEGGAVAVGERGHGSSSDGCRGRCHATSAHRHGTGHRTPSRAPRLLPHPYAGPTMQCDYFDARRCRSCTLMGSSYRDQVADKTARAAAALEDAAPGLRWLEPVTGPEAHFRNKAKLVVAGRAGAPTFGILDAGGRGVDLRRCGLYEPGLAATFDPLHRVVSALGIEPYDVPGRRGELKHLIVTHSPLGEHLVRFVVRSPASVDLLRSALPDITAALPSARVVTANVLPEHKAVLEGDTEVVLSADSHLTMRLPEVTLLLGPRSFFQTNTRVATALYAQARAWTDDLSPATVLDLYCGVGGFALHLAAPGRQVVGVETSEEAVAAATAGAHLNGLGSPEVEFVAGTRRTT